ncbi:MerR family transcriptional regulator [Roseovarius dicentrarchi]|uniref:MerR family transcriptional regulator n=1 Tax=Roseovarius dicentrarchi TaxID=2250573 RepID=UPI001EF0CF6F|nr:MerR family transcriptional regulator [Roseovarius dicentrarchi]
MSKSADAFRTISEVADWLGIPAHVLRFWESKFTQVKPVKRAGGRRYYRPADMRLLGGIRKLLHDDGMTIKGVQKVMRDHGVRHVAAMSPPLDDDLEEVIAEIALDVTDTEEPRGTVLNFDRTRPDPEQRTQDAAPSDMAAPEAETIPPEPSSSASAQGAPAPEQNATGTPEKAATPPEPQDAAPEPETAAEDRQPPETARKVEDTEDAADATPAADLPPEDDAPDPETLEAGAAACETGDTSPLPINVAETPDAPRVAVISVPDDPDDDVPAGTSAMAQLSAADPTHLAAQQPALTGLADRISVLRARMTTSADSL